MGLGYLPRRRLGLREGADVLLTHVESEHDEAQQTLGSSRRPGAWLSLSWRPEGEAHRREVERAVDEFCSMDLLVNKRGVPDVAAIIDVGHNTDPAG